MDFSMLGSILGSLDLGNLSSILALQIPATGVLKSVQVPNEYVLGTWVKVFIIPVLCKYMVIKSLDLQGSA